ncbi:MAG TPA: hypothetical protein VGM14_20860 [Streptosporangiaceae bacterium]
MTLERPRSASPGFELVTRDQVAPFQCSIRVWDPAPLPNEPTVQASQGESTATELSSLSSGLGLGGRLPFQLSQTPAAQALLADRAATPRNWELDS